MHNSFGNCAFPRTERNKKYRFPSILMRKYSIQLEILEITPQKQIKRTHTQRENGTQIFWIAWTNTQMIFLLIFFSLSRYVYSPSNQSTIRWQRHQFNARIWHFSAFICFSLPLRHSLSLFSALFFSLRRSSLICLKTFHHFQLIYFICLCDFLMWKWDFLLLYRRLYHYYYL